MVEVVGEVVVTLRVEIVGEIVTTFIVVVVGDVVSTVEVVVVWDVVVTVWVLVVSIVEVVEDVEQVVVAPSRVDTFGLAIVESLMSGTPVVTSPLASHYELGLPLRYAESDSDYIAEVNKLKDEPKFGLLSDICRFSAMRFDKKVVMDKLEDMFCKVANES